MTQGVLTNKYKKDPATDRLEDNNGRKSRIAFNNPIFESIAKKKGEHDDYPYSAPVANALLQNIILSDA